LPTDGRGAVVIMQSGMISRRSPVGNRRREK
jgi:hypothetical protein